MRMMSVEMVEVGYNDRLRWIEERRRRVMKGSKREKRRIALALALALSPANADSLARSRARILAHSPKFHSSIADNITTTMIARCTDRITSVSSIRSTALISTIWNSILAFALIVSSVYHLLVCRT
jgi:hypothetical protein